MTKIAVQYKQLSGMTQIAIQPERLPGMTEIVQHCRRALTVYSNQARLCFEVIAMLKLGCLTMKLMANANGSFCACACSCTPSFPNTFWLNCMLILSVCVYDLVQAAGEVVPDNLYRMSIQLIKVSSRSHRARLVYIICWASADRTDTMHSVLKVMS